ncbi:hypothetical protein [Stieleria mannarensis]|uniref:hypothetical protein n=1 Tax=Stieleria mannarensis TaxID=2755585 RepID=UPI0015FFC599|nr:hypothetical protein [Rhodopirellula sp. JC639]
MEIQREIIQIVSGSWDVVWICPLDRKVYTSAAFIVAAVKEYEIKRDSQGRVIDKRYLWDTVVPHDPNDTEVGSLVDAEGYIGFVPAGVDVFDAKYALEFPLDVKGMQ